MEPVRGLRVFPARRLVDQATYPLDPSGEDW